MRTRKKVKLSREEVYRRVWELPLRKVAATLGISDVGLKKACRRAGIPTPPQGYHLMSDGPKKKRAEIPLPPREEGQPEGLSFQVPDASVAAIEQDAVRRAQELAASQLPPVPPERKRAVEATLSELRRMVDRRKIDRRGLVAIPSSGFPVHVSPKSFNRAFQILGSLLMRFSAYGAQPSPILSEHGRPVAGFEFEGFEFHFSIEETSQRIEVPLTPPPKRGSNVDGWVLGPVRDWRVEPTGKLIFSAWGPGSGGYKKLSDRNDRIEDRFNEVVAWVFAQGAVAKEEARIETERTERAIAYLREKDKPRLEAEFQKRRQRQLEFEARQWRRAMALREYLSAVERGRPEVRMPTTSKDESKFHAWLAWAKSYADSLDPITQDRAGTTPPYPEPPALDRIPGIFLDFDDPAEAEAAMEKEPWRGW